MGQRANSRLLDFYLGVETDDRGRHLREMLQWPDAQLEQVHDYIQWMFPLTEKSAFNIRAPVLTPSDISEFRSNPELRQNLKASFVRILGFYGLILSGSHPLKVKRALYFEEAFGELDFTRKSQSFADHQNSEESACSGLGRGGDLPFTAASKTSIGRRAPNQAPEFQKRLFRFGNGR
jgi:Opioid growth factor receptor (OGFr) conserved region